MDFIAVMIPEKYFCPAKGHGKQLIWARLPTFLVKGPSILSSQMSTFINFYQLVSTLQPLPFTAKNQLGCYDHNMMVNLAAKVSCKQEWMFVFLNIFHWEVDRLTCECLRASLPPAITLKWLLVRLGLDTHKLVESSYCCAGVSQA